MEQENKTLKEVRVKDLPPLGQLDNSHVLLAEDSASSYKVPASVLMEYVKDHPDIADKFILKTQKGTAGGVAPLDTASKLSPAFLSFGESQNTVFEGSRGKSLETFMESHAGNTGNPHGVTKGQLGLGHVENKSSADIREELTYGNVTNALGFTPEIDGTYEQATAYTDSKIAELINGAPETLDTLKELADALTDNESAVEAITESIGKKANQAELDSHTDNSVIHVTQTDKNNLNTALQHAQGSHARTDATKTEPSDTNGSLLINDTEIPVYQHPLSGIAAGTYRQVTVDSKGHVTAGDNTTLPITQGGTGASSPEQALVNLGVTATADELNRLDGITATAAELNCLKGVTASVQTQLDNKAPASHGTHVPASNTDNQGKFLKSNGAQPVYGSLTAAEISAALGYVPGTGSNIITAVKGDAETQYQTGEYNITPAKIGLGSVDNTHDSEKSVLSALRLTNPRKIGAALFDGTGNITLKEIGGADREAFDAHTKASTAHVSETERTKWNNKMDSDSDTQDNTVTFTTNDTPEPSDWSSMELLTTGEPHSSIFGKISTAFRNLRYLYKMLGTTDISSVGNGTVTGAISAINMEISNLLKVSMARTSAVIPVGSFDVTISAIPPDGYTCLGVVGWTAYSHSATINITGCTYNSDDNTVTIIGYNSGGETTISPRCYLLHAMTTVL